MFKFKKVEEDARQWIDRFKPTIILVISGPSGSAKSSAISLLAASNNIDIIDWENPSSFSSKPDYDDENFKSSDNLSVYFENFLETAGSYSSLSFSNQPTKNATNKIVLVKDIPNIVNQNTRSRIKTAIKTYLNSDRSVYPLVFIITNVSNSNYGNFDNSQSAWKNNNEDSVLSIRSLFDPNILLGGKIKQISFNPIAPTILVKALKGILVLEGRVLEKEELDAVVLNSGGDIRCAINSLQFIFTGKKKVNTGKGVASKRKRNSDKNKSDEIAPLPTGFVGDREANLVLFHAIGKVLTNKRGTEIEKSSKLKYQDQKLQSDLITSEYEYPDIFKNIQQPPLAFNPDAVFVSSHTSGHVFDLFLFQNYPHFFKDIDEIDFASEYLSISDSINRHWESKGIIDQYSTSIASRGLLFSHFNPTVSSAGKARLIKKPEIWNVQKDRNEKDADIKCFFQKDWASRWCLVESNGTGFAMHHGYTNRTLMEDVVPFLGIMNRSNTVNIPTSKSVIRSIPSYQRHWISQQTQYSRLFDRSGRTFGSQGYSKQGDFITDIDVIVEEENDVEGNYVSALGLGNNVTQHQSNSSYSYLNEDDIED